MGALDGFRAPAPSAERADVLGGLAAAIVSIGAARRVVVALDGVDGAGKTVLADELAHLIAPVREVHRAGVDGFHHPRAVRYARGGTPETFYRDSYDYAALRRELLTPFRCGEPYRAAVHDVERDQPVGEEGQQPAAGPAAMMLFDGIFLHRPELTELWDASLWVEVPFAVSVPRGNARFGPVTAERADPDSAINARYVVAQRRYLAAVRPAELATWVMDNTEFDRPTLDGPR
jgi:uridine kinase